MLSDILIHRFVHFNDLVTELLESDTIQSNEKLYLYDIIEQPSETSEQDAK